MKKRWRLFRPPEQEPPVTQQAEAVPGVDAVPDEISHEEAVCEKCGRPYEHTRKLGEIANKTVKEMTAETAAKDDRETPSESVVLYESLMACDKTASHITSLSGKESFNVSDDLCADALKFLSEPPTLKKREALKALWLELYRQLDNFYKITNDPHFWALLSPEQRNNLEQRREALREIAEQAGESYDKCREAIDEKFRAALYAPGREWTVISPFAG